MKTVKVRVIVAVDCEGNWSAGAHSGENDRTSVYVDNLKEGERYFWLTAELPVPEDEQLEVAADVESAAPTVRCDIQGCIFPVDSVCTCRRCSRESEPEEKFHSCSHHKADVGEMHQRIRGRDVEWSKL